MKPISFVSVLLIVCEARQLGHYRCNCTTRPNGSDSRGQSVTIWYLQPISEFTGTTCAAKLPHLSPINYLSSPSPQSSSPPTNHNPFRGKSLKRQPSSATAAPAETPAPRPAHPCRRYPTVSAAARASPTRTPDRAATVAANGVYECVSTRHLFSHSMGHLVSEEEGQRQRTPSPAHPGTHSGRGRYSNC